MVMGASVGAKLVMVCGTPSSRMQEVFFLKTRDDVAVLRGGDNFEGDDGNVDGNGDAGLRRLLRRGCRRRSRVLLLLRRGTALRAGGSLGKDGILGQRQAQTGRQNCEQNYGKNGLHHVPLDCDQKFQTSDHSCLRGGVVAKKRLNLSNATPMPRPSAHTCMLV